MKTATILFTAISAVHAAILGLDYGQQFAKAALLAPGVNFEVVLTDEGKRKDLSGILIRQGKDDLERVYGSQTGSLCTRFPQSCVVDVKALLGKSISDPSTKQYLHQHFGVKLLEDESRSGSIKFDLGFSNQSYAFTVEEVFAMHLNEFKSRALNELTSGASNAIPLVEDVVISIPAFASPETRQSYLDSLYLANFSSPLGLVDDGSAVALNYLSSRKFDPSEYDDKVQYHLVYDMGAGSTKATLFSFVPFKNGSIHLELQNFGYDASFGGKLLTDSIYSIISEKFLSKFGLKHSELTPKIVAKLVESAEKAKLILSVNTEYHVSLESIYYDKDFKTVVSRDEFEEINSDLMDRITRPIFNALADSDLTLSDIKSVIINGGSTRVPFVQKHLASLVGEDKISKSVNADESAALGTTLRGLKLKTQLAKANDIKVIEKSYHNFEVEVSGQSEQQVVFPKKSVVDQVSRVGLGQISNELEVGLYEDGRLFKTYSFDDLLKKTEKFTCKSSDSKELFGHFNLDHNKIFDLVKVEVECVKEEGLLGKLLNKGKTSEEATIKEDEEFEESGESSNSTNSTEAKKPKIKRAPAVPKTAHVPIPKPIYPGVKPLLRTTKEKLLSKLGYLNARDEIKSQLDHVKNVLEAKCYELRAYIDTNEETLGKEMENLSEYTKFIGELIEWLEFESEDATLEDTVTKTKQLASKKMHLERTVEIASTNITSEGISKLHSDGLYIVNTIQEKLLDFGKEVLEIRAKFNDEGFDFDKENNKQKALLLAKGDDASLTFEKKIEDFRAALDKVTEVLGLSDDEFTSISKNDLFGHYDALSRQVAGMLNDLIKIETSHRERVEALNTKYTTLSTRKQQKELKDQLKKAKKAKEEEETKEEEEEGVIIEEEDEEVISETLTVETLTVETLTAETLIAETQTSSSAEPTESDIVHDEL